MIFLCKMYKYIIKGIDWHVNNFSNCPIYILFKENGAGILNVESDNEKLKRAGGG